MQQNTWGPWQVRGSVVGIQMVVRPGPWLWLRPVVTLCLLGVAAVLVWPHLDTAVTRLSALLGTVLGWALVAALVTAVFRIRLPWWGRRSVAWLVVMPLTVLCRGALWLLGGLRVRRSPRRTVQMVRVVSAGGTHQTVFVPCDGADCALTPGDPVTVRGWPWRGVCRALAVRNGRSGQRWGLGF